MATDTGRWIGQYQVIREIGRGAEGIVYQARDPAIGRAVAIKELPLSKLSPDEVPEARQRFVREAQAVGNLRHENIVTLYQFIEQTDSLFLVMEFVPGGSLQARMIGTTDEALGIIRQVAAALDHAHSNGIVHRDIKPGNILVSSNPVNNRPVMKVADFGIARFLSRTMTMTGVSLGTPAYMAPEQIQGSSKVDAKADQFSLGVLAYELLSRRLPFIASNYQALMFQIVNGEPASLLEANPSLPPEVEFVIRRALAKNPDQRFASCGEFAAALEQALAPPAPPTIRTVRPKRGVNKGALTVVGALLVVATALYFLWPGLDRGSTEPGRLEVGRVNSPAANRPGFADLKTGNDPENRTAEKGTEPSAGEKSPKEPARPVSDVGAKSREEVWRAIQDWNSSVLAGDVRRYRESYADRLTRFYGHADAPVEEAVQMMADEIRKYPVRELTVSNPSFQLASDGVQVDYDKAYRFSGSGVRLNQGEVKATLRLTQTEAGTWKITAEFDREICWSTQMRDPAMQSPPGSCR